VKVLLLFLLLTFLFAIRAANRGRRSRIWILLVVTAFVATSLMTRRAI
jgi:hypothetical protein